MRVMVCGGAGYIGSHMVRALLEAGHGVVVVDNLSTGHAGSVTGAPLVRADIRDGAAMDAAFRAHPVDAVMHFCASSLVGESMREPWAYYDNNVGGSLSLLAAMRRAGVERLVFSSTAAIFGQPRAALIDEDHPAEPINPYGRSKWMVERILADHAEAYGLRSTALRYFNAAGAHPDGSIGEAHEPETHLVPNVLRAALGQGPGLKVFGTDYPTPDGTCVRDYVHVLDLAAAHLLALERMGEGPAAKAYNLGNGRGFSVREVIDTARRITGRAIAHEDAPRRPGDPAVLVASSARARAELGWSPAHAALEDIVATAWRWHQAPRY